MSYYYQHSPGGGPGQGNNGGVGGPGPGHPDQNGPGDPGQGVPFGFDINEGVSEAIYINGKPHLLRRSRYVFDEETKDYILEIVYENRLPDGNGDFFRADEFAGFSWDRNIMTFRTKFKCINPYELHGLRYCRIDVDGFPPKLNPNFYWSRGFVLCDRCNKINNRRILLRAFFWWLGYQPEVY